MSLNINKKIKKFKKTVDKLWKRFYNTKELNILLKKELYSFSIFSKLIKLWFVVFLIFPFWRFQLNIYLVE